MKLTIATQTALTDAKKTELAVELGKSLSTIRNWVRDNHENLTLLKTIEALTKVTGIEAKDLFENETVTKIINKMPTTSVDLEWDFDQGKKDDKDFLIEVGDMALVIDIKIRATGTEEKGTRETPGSFTIDKVDIICNEIEVRNEQDEIVEYPESDFWRLVSAIYDSIEIL